MGSLKEAEFNNWAEGYFSGICQQFGSGPDHLDLLPASHNSNDSGHHFPPNSPISHNYLSATSETWAISEPELFWLWNLMYDAVD